MATLADELQNDFADSGSEDENEENRHSLSPTPNGQPRPSEAMGEDGGMELDDSDGDSDGDEDLSMGEANGLLEDVEEEEQAKLKIHSSEPRDMRTVASFMKSMEPVLEVSDLLTFLVLKEYEFTISQPSDLTLSHHAQKIEYYRLLPPDKQTKNIGQIEDNPEYQLLTKSNTFSTSIDDQAAEVHKYIRDHYSARFPELETLLSDPLEYTKAVAIIGNGPMDHLQDLSSLPHNIVEQPLNSILSRPKLMTVTVEATTTKGQKLSDQELEAVLNACRTMLRLEQAKKILTDYVQSRMNLFAPNLTALIGSLTAAQLLNARGGLTNLANSRAANLASIGSKRAGATSGLATNVGIRNQGFLYQSSLIARFRPELKTQAMRIVSAKIVLAARVDRVHESPDGATGADLREQCEKRLDRLTEPPPNKGQKALPAPDDKPSKKRGGRRARKAKEATAMTDIRKAQNRMAFGKEEQEVGYGTGEGTKGMGMIGQSNEGRIRALQVDQRTRAKLSKNNPGWGGTASSVVGGGGGGGAASSLRGFAQGAGTTTSVLKGHGLRTSGLATNLGAGGGTVSSLAFTPKQGLELVDPKVRAEMERKEKVDQDRWFKGGTFTQVGGGGGGGVGGGEKDGFKVPSLSKKRKLENGD